MAHPEHPLSASCHSISVTYSSSCWHIQNIHFIPTVRVLVSPTSPVAGTSRTTTSYQLSQYQYDLHLHLGKWLADGEHPLSTSCRRISVTYASSDGHIQYIHWTLSVTVSVWPTPPVMGTSSTYAEHPLSLYQYDLHFQQWAHSEQQLSTSFHCISMTHTSCGLHIQNNHLVPAVTVSVWPTPPVVGTFRTTT